ncbi:MAG: DNA mismatch endonuclease Vsr [Roseburia faecis]|uniref:very short patch repair endonuclease n=1 Tax=Selenomonas bovis TaxID=416586 RepID=UPI0003627F07|nr:DNA mismatch endonuclease Vsr [Selenomonas bovis]MDY6279835.1 DNA mismatch endonuclease Vsr [Roseburia faecis]
MDTFTTEKRSEIMSCVPSKNTKPEEFVRKYLFSQGFRYRKNDKRYPGTPDIVLPKYRTVVFVNGCFWHQHPGCRKATIPAAHHDYWKAKLNRNVERDKEEINKLREMGWRVIIVWECEIASKVKRKQRLPELADEIKSATLLDK